MFVVSKSTSKAGTDWGGGRGSSQCLLLVNPHQKQVQTGGGEGELPVFVVSKSTSKAGTDCRGRGSSQCLLLVNPHQKQLQTVGGGGAPSVYC